MLNDEGRHGSDGLFKWKVTRTLFRLATRTVIFFVPEHAIIILTATKSERLYYKAITVRVTKVKAVRVTNLAYFTKTGGFLTPIALSNP